MMRHLRWGLLVLSLGTTSSQATNLSTPSYDVLAQSLAASCSGCHAKNSELASLDAMQADSIYRSLVAFQSGERHSTVMQRIALGYSESELRMLAEYLGQNKLSP